MKMATPRKVKRGGGSASFTLSHAELCLGRLMARAEQGELVYIVHGHRKVLLQPVVEIEPIPMRPAGYFDSCYTPEEIASDHQLAKASVLRATGDLE
jgi:hypothetical protein